MTKETYGSPGDTGVVPTMFSQSDIFNRGLVQVVRNLKKAGFEDITTEDVTLKNGNKVCKFRFFTEEQWISNPANLANKATQLFGKTHLGKYKMPDHIVKYQDETYFVTII